MSYNKMMKRTQSHRHDKDYQTIFHNAFEGETEVHGEAYFAEKEMASGSTCYVGVKQQAGDEYTKISPDFNTEDEAVDFINDNQLDEQYLWVSVFTAKGFRLCG